MAKRERRRKGAKGERTDRENRGVKETLRVEIKKRDRGTRRIEIKRSAKESERRK